MNNKILTEDTVMEISAEGQSPGGDVLTPNTTVQTLQEIC